MLEKLSLGSITEILRAGSKVWFAMALTLGFLLFAPVGVLKRLALSEIIAEKRAWLALAFVIALAFIISAILARLWAIVAGPIRWRLFQERGYVRRLRDLSSAEREHLAQYLLNDTKTVHSHFGDGVTGGLEAAEIIFRSSTIGSPAMTFPYNIQPWAWKALRRNPELVGVSRERLAKRAESKESGSVDR